MAKKIKLGSIGRAAAAGAAVGSTGATASLGVHLTPVVRSVGSSASLGAAVAPVASSVVHGVTPKGPSTAVLQRQRAERQRQKRVKQARVNIGKQRRKLKKDAKAKPRKAQKVISKLPTPEQLPAKLAVKFGKKYDVPPSLLMGQMKQESGFNPGAVSSAGAFGLSQFIPSTAQSYHVKPGTSRHAQRTQVRGQAHYMGDLLKQTGNTDSALSSYSGGYSQSAYNAPVEANTSSYKRLDKVAGVKGVKTAGTPKPLPGPWDGSRSAVSIGLRGVSHYKGGKRTPAENSAVGGSPTSDHLTTNKQTYAKDVPATGAQGDAIFSKVAKNLGIKNAQPGTYNWYTSPKAPGYRFQILWHVEGHYDHVHVGAEYVGSGATATSGGTATYSASGTSGGTGGGYTPAGSPSGRGSVASRKRGGRSHRRDVAARQGRKTATRLISHYRSNLTKGEVKPATFTPTTATRKLVKLS